MRRLSLPPQSGFSLIEVLVTVVLLAFGLLGVAGMQAKTSKVEFESFQRSQALALVSDMAARLQAGTLVNPTAYVTTAMSPTYLGTGDENGSCAGLTDTVALDQCEWSSALKGAAEAVTGGANSGAMIGARGCIKELRAPVTTAGACAAGLYEVTVVWQGMHETVAPGVNNTCAKTSTSLFGNEKLRRSVTLHVGAGTAGCL